jgi:5-methyltetrahydropteroyltriglutamate--homocysteine methyltransferase
MPDMSQIHIIGEELSFDSRLPGADNRRMIATHTPSATTIYRADQVGSFLRPAELLAARANPNVSPEQLREVEDRSILDCLHEQAKRGFRIFSDGELRRASFMSDFNDSVEGIESGDAVRRQWSGAVVTKLGVATGRIRSRRRMTKHEVEFLKLHSPGDIKMTLPSANQFPAIAYKKGVTDAVYPTYSDFLWDCAAVVASEVKALAAEVQYIQLDAPRYSYYVDPKWRHYIEADMGLDPVRALDEAIAVDNLALRDVTGRPGVTTCIHLCRGNNRSQWYAEGGYDAIAEKLFSELDVNAFSLEYDTDRSGTFEPLRFVPKGKLVVLGLISTKVADLEPVDLLIRRIEAAAKYVPLDQCTVSPQCGFASMAEGNMISADDQWRKLDLVAEVARRVWGTT